MGIKYNIYKYFADKKNLNSITQDMIDGLSIIMKRFDISDITIDDSYIESKSLTTILNKFTLPLNPSGRNHIIISASKETTNNNNYIFSVKEFLSLLNTPEYIINTEIPRIFNTLENIYDRFLVVGTSSYSNTIYSYLSANPNISVGRYGYDDTASPEFISFIDTLDSDTLIIIANLCSYKQLTSSKGNQFQTFYMRRLYAPFGKTTEYLLDLNARILPRLHQNNVNVIWIYIPDDNRLKRIKEIKKKLRYWERLRRYAPELFNHIRARQENSTKLQAELASIINDNTRGYSTNYHNGQYINFDNGFRRTIGNTSSKTNSVYIYGPCLVRGSNYEDSQTIPSLVKSQLSDNYNVYNMGSTFHTINYIMREKEYAPGDIVVVFSPTQKDSNVKPICDAEIDLTDVYNEINDVENHVFDITVHFDKVIAGAIADKIASTIKSLKSYSLLSDSNDHPNFIRNTSKVSFGPSHKRIASIESLADKSLSSWLKSQKENIKVGNYRNGAIVMNCNPFTNGHRYLIDQASKQVDNLYIFVVEEDKSEFKFEDRIKLVKLGTKDLDNVTVLKSGKYVISSQTLPGYFDKKNLGTVDLNAQNDLEYFLCIANYFGISVRFAGEEPIDMFTNQYNVNMKKILPKYGVEFIEIPRKQNGSTVISASAVRKAMHEGNWDLVKELVPPTTYDFLKKM